MINIMPALLDGMKVTVFLFSITLIISIPCGMLLGFVSISHLSLVKRITRLYVYIMRGTPLLLQLMFIFFGLTHIGITVERMPAAILALSLNYTAYFAEIFRGGISAVDKEQFEAIDVLQISKYNGIKSIIIPQVMKITMPSIGNEVISLIKDTSLVYVLGIGELLRVGQIAANTYASLTPFVAVALCYLLLTAVISFCMKLIEKKYSY